MDNWTFGLGPLTVRYGADKLGDVTVNRGGNPKPHTVGKSDPKGPKGPKSLSNNIDSIETVIEKSGNAY